MTLPRVPVALPARAGRRVTVLATTVPLPLGMVVFTLVFGRARRLAGRLVLLTTRGATPLHDFAFAPDDVLLFGRESAGVPEEVHARADARVVFPMAPGVRSMNLSVSAGIVAAEALRQTGGWPG